MQNSSQVSIWVPILVAILGIVGVIAGQVVNAVRESRQWKRSTEKELEKLAHADTLDWRNMRIATYGKFLSITAEVTNKVGILNTSLGSEADLWRAAEVIEDLFDRTKEVASEIALIGSTETTALIKDYERTLWFITIALTPMEMPESNESHNQVVKDIFADLEEVVPQVEATAKELHESFRADLGISQID